MDAASAAVYASTASEGSITIAAASAASNASVLPAGLQKFKVKNGFYDGPDNPDDEPKDLRRIQSAPTKPVKDDAPVTRNSVHDLHEELKAQKAAQGNVKALSAGEQKEMREFFQKGHSKEDTFNYFTDGTGLDATSVRAFLDEVYSAKDTLIEAACVDGTASGQVAETGCEADAASTHAELTQQELLSQSPEPNVTAKAATPRADPTPLAELKVMRLKSLKEKAIEMGCDQKTVGDVDEDVDPKQAAIDLILKMNAVAHEAVQLAELRGMSLRKLKQKAIELGYEKEAVEDADADENPKQAVIDLILKATFRVDPTLWQGINLKRLKNLARDTGLDEKRIQNSDDTEDPKAAVMQLISEKVSQGMNLKQLKNLARAVGFDDNIIAEADDTPDPNAAVMKLLSGQSSAKAARVSQDEGALEDLEKKLCGSLEQVTSGLFELARSGRIAQHIKLVDRCLADENVTVRTMAYTLHLAAPLQAKPSQKVSFDGKQFTSRGQPVPPSHWGITKGQVREFYHEFLRVVGCERMTARTMVDNLICPKYVSGRSVALEYNDECPLAIEVLISHSWDENVKEFLEDLLSTPLSDATVLFICFLCVYQGTEEEIDLQVTQGMDDIHYGCFARILRHVSKKAEPKMFVIPNDALAHNGQGLYSRLSCTWEVYNCYLWGIEIVFWPDDKATEKHFFGGQDPALFTAENGHCGPPNKWGGKDELQIKRAVEAGAGNERSRLASWQNVDQILGGRSFPGGANKRDTSSLDHQMMKRLESQLRQTCQAVSSARRDSMTQAPN